MKSAIAALAFALCLPTSAWASASDDGGVRAEIARDMEEARREIRADIARSRVRLDIDNLDVSNSLQFNGSARRRTDADARPVLPKAEITPQGDFLIDGAAVEVDAAQRRQLQAYREQVIAVARAGIDIGEIAALAAVDSVDRGLGSLIVGSMTGSVQRQVQKTVMQSVGPGVEKICAAMPALHASQQQLAASVPEFGPYARIEASDGERCVREVRQQFARS